ncbi:MAG: hypothetical protein ACI8R9_002358 [Paraglaciecola sp.]|jgi:hypothetical protein
MGDDSQPDRLAIVTPETQPLLRKLAIYGIQYGLLIVFHIYPPSAVKSFQLNNISQKLISDYQRMHFLLNKTPLPGYTSKAIKPKALALPSA